MKNKIHSYGIVKYHLMISPCMKLIDHISKNLQHNTVVEAYSNIDNI